MRRLATHCSKSSFVSVLKLNLDPETGVGRKGRNTSSITGDVVSGGGSGDSSDANGDSIVVVIELHLDGSNFKSIEGFNYHREPKE